MGQYIHYGSNAFDHNRFTEIQNRETFTKPIGGLWACGKDYRDSWRNWCIGESFGIDKLDTNFEFDLCENARILKIHHASDLDKLPKIEFPIFKFSSFYTCLDFEKLANDYDAIEVLISSDRSLFIDHSLYTKLYGWDCDSILIMNKDVILCESITNKERTLAEWKQQRIIPKQRTN